MHMYIWVFAVVYVVLVIRQCKRSVSAVKDMLKKSVLVYVPSVFRNGTITTWRGIDLSTATSRVYVFPRTKSGVRTF